VINEGFMDVQVEMFDQFTACLLCESKNLNPLKGYEKNYIVQCNECEFVFCQRKPVDIELKHHYSLYPRVNSISEITIERYNTLLDKFDKYRNTNNLIDVGCGGGFFLVAAKKRGWNVFGTEFAEEAISICSGKGIQMTKSPLDAANYKNEYFDVITSFEVIEHINNPRPELASYHKILRRGGVVYVTTPNFNSISRDIVGSRWSVIEYPEHLSYYTKRTLSEVFTNSDFSLLEMDISGISFNRLKSSKGIYAINGGTNTDERLRVASENKFFFHLLKKMVNYLLNLFAKGDAMKGLFQKN
jgi:2-polyprenyl-3-methyl-5-hydroxy-6-metoxy-1,4-benzoquinol methylase